MRVPRSSMERYLSKREGSNVVVVEYVRLGSGWHGTGYRITYKVKGKTKKAVLRTINPIGFSHDYPSDRVAVFVLQDKMFNSIPSHIRSIDVGGYGSGGELISIGDAKEFFQVVEVASGEPYVRDLERIAAAGRLEDGDVKKAKCLSDFLVKLHSQKLKAAPAVKRSLKLRHLRDSVGHGEMLMGVVDTYPDKLKWISKDGLQELVCESVRGIFSIRNIDLPLSKVHGDYHPGNIWFRGRDKFTLLDASRQLWGLPADDITALTVNYIAFALRTTGKFSGPMKTLFDVFWKNYIKKTGDKRLAKTVAAFFAFRLVVVAHPIFYPDQSDDVRKKLIMLAFSILRERQFNPSKINKYMGLE